MADQPIVPLHLRSDEDLEAALRRCPARSPGPSPSHVRRRAGHRRGGRARASSRGSRARPSTARLAANPARSTRWTLVACASRARRRDHRAARPRRGRRRRPDSGCRASGSSSAGHPPAAPRSPSATRRPTVRRRRSRASRRRRSPARSGPPRRHAGIGPARRRRSALGDARRASGLRRSSGRRTRPSGRRTPAWVDPALNDQVALVWPSSDRLPATDGAGGRPGPDRLPRHGRRRLFTKVLGAGHDRRAGAASATSPGTGSPATRTCSSTRVRTGFVDDSRRWVGDVLLWADGPITYRLETSLGGATLRSAIAGRALR